MTDGLEKKVGPARTGVPIDADDVTYMRYCKISEIGSIRSGLFKAIPLFW